MRVQLVFNSFFKLWYFKQIVNDKNFKTSLKNCSISGECTESEITLAVYAYQARVKEIG
jgi:hypothetical protein